MRKILLMVLMLCSILLVSCGAKQGQTQASISDNTIKGRAIFVQDSDIAFFGYDNLLCSADYVNGSLSDFEIKASLTGNIYALAVYENSLYVSESNGIFKYSLDMLSGESEETPKILIEDDLSRNNHFEIYDGKLFYLNGSTLCYISCNGGLAHEMAADVGDFEVTDNGIYYTKKDGNLHLVSSDFSTDTSIAEVAPGCTIIETAGKLYFQDDELKAYLTSKGSVERVRTVHNPKDIMSSVWSDGNNLFYIAVDSELRFVASGKETELGVHDLFPCNKVNGYVCGNKLLGYADDTIEVYSFTDGQIKNYKVGSKIESQLSELSVEQQTPEEPEAASESYDILSGLQIEKKDEYAYLYGNDFTLVMPDDDDWEYRQVSADSFSIIHIPSAEAGYGGKLVTIKAYDENDTSYTIEASYTVVGAGANTNKVFVAIYPTNNQTDDENAERYDELFEYLKKISTNMLNSPLKPTSVD